MRKLPKRKEILIPLKAGLRIMERYGLYCQCQDNWSDAKIQDCLERIHSSRAPHHMRIDDKVCRVNIASPNAAFRQKSIQIVERFITLSEKAPNCSVVVIPAAPHFWTEDAGAPCEVREVGEYGIMVESLRYLSHVAKESGMRLALENHIVPWNEIEQDEEYKRGKHHGNVCEYFASSPNEWSRICSDAGADNLGLCLDTSHAVTYSHRFPTETRDGMLGLFLALGGDRLWHIQWSDNFVDSAEGRLNNRLQPGKGTISKSFHRQLWEHPTAMIYMFNHWTHEGELADATRFVERL